MINLLSKTICFVIYPFWFAYRFCKLFPANYRNAIKEQSRKRLASKKGQDWRDQIRQRNSEPKQISE